MQKTVGLTRVGSGRASAGRGQRNNFGFHLSNVSYDGKIAGLYDLEETLGRGHFAVVKLARHVFTGEKVAVKVIDKTKLDEISRAHLFQEVRCMKLVQHPNVVRLYEVIDTQTKLYLILELGDGGDLYDYIMRHENGLDQESARHYFRQVVHAISYCHQLHVVHRDLKPENVVFFEKLGMVKLTDFGFSNKYNPGQKLETSCGSLAYSAPEILLGDSYDAPAVDIWSLGVILYMLVCGHPPFQEANDSETLTMIMDCKYTVPPHVSEGCRRLIGRMLQRDPANRANLEEIANDPWLQDGAAALPPAHYLPLVSREHLTEDDHAIILQKMVNGNIATKEEILDALDKDEYNNITATYFLLAERKLRAQRQEQAQMISRRQPPAPPPPLEPDPKARMNLMDAMQTSSVGRQRKYSDVVEEDEATGGSGSESSRRSQRSSSNSLASQRTSNTSLASQRASNNSLAGSLRARGLLANVSTTIQAAINKGPTRSSELRLDFVDKMTPQVSITKLASASSKPLEPQKSVDQFMEVPAPFPTTSNIGLGLRSPRTSPLTSPVTGQRTGIIAGLGSGRATPASISPTSPSTTPSSPGSSPNVMSPTVNSKSRSTLPSPNRVLHSVRSSPQLILNEIFEEAESCSDSESTSRGESAIASAKSPGLRIRTTLNGHRHRPSQSGRASSAGPAGPSVRTSTSPPSLVRRYEQRRQLAKARTASCSSSDASDDDNESRKKRAEKLKTLPPRRDSHDDSSDPGCDGPGGGNDGAGVSGGGGTTSMDSYNQPGSSSETPKSSDSGNQSGGSSGGRRHLQPSDCVDQRNPRSRYRIVGTSHGRRYTNACFSLLSPGLGSETHLRVSQSLSCLTEVCETPESPRIVTNTLEIPPSTVGVRVAAKSCSNLEKIEETVSLDTSPEVVLVLPPSPILTSHPASEKGSLDTVVIQDDVMDTEPEPPLTGCSCSCTTPASGKKHKRLKQLFSRREGTNLSFKRSDKRPSGRKSRGRSNGEDVSMDADDKQPGAAEPDSGEAGEVNRGKTMNFLRSRLYKARSLGCLVKERILVEASHCQYELWKRFGRKGGIVGVVSPSDVNMNGPTHSPTPAKLSTVTSCSSSAECSTPSPLAVVHNVTQHCTSC
uniref:SNF-related serine/threonine-protein kinase n=1 Tax=Daphnia galeata TaxID=27404 RepID=A0A8J2RVS7_9CRUS|nr:unnamed protein product [Daphnia galeata]